MRQEIRAERLKNEQLRLVCGAALAGSRNLGPIEIRLELQMVSRCQDQLIALGPNLIIQQ